MANLGTIRSDVDMAGVSGPAVRCGNVTVTITDLTKAVTFSSPMPSAAYEVFALANGLATTLGVTSKLAGGFTLTLSVGVAGTVSYLAVGQV